MNASKMMACGLVLAAGALWADSPVVDAGTVTLVQDKVTKTVTVGYTLTGAPGIVTVDLLTNGVSIGAANFANVKGDVNRKVAVGAHRIEWRPHESLWAQLGVTNVLMTARVTAWSPLTPPDYLALGLDTANDVRYYVSTNALPGGFGADTWRTTHVLFRKIPAAGVTWRMGAEETEVGYAGYESREKPHLVTLTNDYFMTIFNLTQEQGVKILGSNPSTRKISDNERFLPLETMSYLTVRGTGWPESGHAVANGTLCATLRARTGMAVDLPTDAQWEYACRAGTCSSLNSGKMVTNAVTCLNLDAVGWYNKNSGGHTHPVGLKAPNAWGLYDMHGNVYDWVLDWMCLTKGPAMTSDPRTEPVGFTTTQAVSTYKEDQRGRRGGTYGHDAKICRTAFRGSTLETDAAANTGVRLVCPLDGQW